MITVLTAAEGSGWVKGLPRKATTEMTGVWGKRLGRTPRRMGGGSDELAPSDHKQGSKNGKRHLCHWETECGGRAKPGLSAG